jgi:hypothetical protein
MLISVALPICNGNPLLSEALASILAQDFDLDFVVSDDGSVECRAVPARRGRDHARAKAQSRQCAPWRVQRYPNILTQQIGLVVTKSNGYAR